MTCHECAFFTHHTYEKRVICGHKDKKMMDINPHRSICSDFIHRESPEYHEGYLDGRKELVGEIQDLIDGV